MKNKDKNNKKISKTTAGAALLSLGVLALVALIWQIFDGALTRAFSQNSGYYFPIAWKLNLLPFLLIGISATVFGARLILDKTHNNIYLAVLAFTLLTTSAMSQLVKPQVYMNNFSGVTELIDTAVEEYAELKDDEHVALHTETMYGEKTPEQSKKLQNAIDRQADANLVIVYLTGVLSTAIFFAILNGGKKAKK